MKQPLRHLDLPTIHLPEFGHHIPRRATKADEIDRRRSLPSGTLRAEEQARGIAIASRLLWYIHEPQDIAYAERMIAAAGINTAWYSYASDSEVMRRRLLLPRIDEADNLEPEAIYNTAAEALADVVPIAGRLVSAHEFRRPTRDTYAAHVGLNVGNASLYLVATPLVEELAQYGYVSPGEIQRRVRSVGLRALEDSRTLYTQIGVHPSLAGLAHPDNQLAYHIRTHAPAGVVEALEYAQS